MTLQVRLRRKSSLWEMRAIAMLLSLIPRKSGSGVWLWDRGDQFLVHFWTAWKRHPWSSTVYILYPEKVENPYGYPTSLLHEWRHVKQIWTACGWFWNVFLYLLFPLPILFSGRWFVERGAYLIDIKHGNMTIDEVVDTLHRCYLWPWPRSWMRKWFQKKVCGS